MGVTANVPKLGTGFSMTGYQGGFLDGSNRSNPGIAILTITIGFHKLNTKQNCDKRL